MQEIMDMVEKNLFRPLPNIKKNTLQFSETGIEAEDASDPVWENIQGIYEFFL